jgi:hypothetical protein
MLRLVESHCVPILIYAVEVSIFPSREKQKMRVAYNSLFRKIFGFRKYDSIRELQGFLSRPTWDELVTSRMESFRDKLHFCPNVLIRALSE